MSGQFSPPGSGAWTITHDGKRNFIVQLYCAGDSFGPQLVQNMIGAVDGSKVVQFGRGLCYWVVQADGAWSLAPR